MIKINLGASAGPYWKFISALYNNGMSNDKKSSDPSIHLSLDAPPPPDRPRRRPKNDPHELHHFDDDKTASATYIMDKTGIYKNRTIAVLRSNRFMITLIIVLCAIVYMLSLTIPPGITGFIERNDVKKQSLGRLAEFIRSQEPLASLIRDMAKEENLKIYVKNTPEIKGQFFKIWDKVPASTIPVTFCKEHDPACPEQLPAATMGDDNSHIFFGIQTEQAKDIPDPYALAFHAKNLPAKYKINIRSINHVMVVPGFEQEFLGVGYYFYVLGVQFLKTWGFIFILIIIFFGANKRPYSKRVEGHKHWSIK